MNTNSTSNGEKATLLIVLFLIFFGVVTNAQEKLKIEDRVKLLETYNKEILDKKFETKSTELSNKIEYDVKKAKDDISDQLWIIKITGGIITLVLGAGIFILLRQYFVGLKKLADKLLKEKLESHLNDNSQFILDMITSQKTENLIKANKKILLVTADETEKNESLALLKSMGFKHIDTIIASSTMSHTDNDLTVFSNNKGNFDENLILKLMEESKEDEALIYYGKRLNIDQQKEYSERINFANSKFTLYHQIINTLSFKEIFDTVN